MASKGDTGEVVSNPQYCKVCALLKLDMSNKEVRADGTKGWRAAGERYRDWSKKTSYHGQDKILGRSIRQVREWADMGSGVSVVEITKQARAGCTVCKILDEMVDAALHNSPIILPFDWDIKLARSPDEKHAKEGITFLLWAKINKMPESYKEQLGNLGAVSVLLVNSLPFLTTWDADFTIYSSKDNNIPFKGITYQQPLPRRLDDPICFDLLRKWLEKCVQEHSTCEGDLASELPSRVISIDNEDGTCRLHISLPGERAKYIALSHCWGHPDTVPRTNQDSLELHKKEIPKEILSTTFKDAIAITKQLGLQYVWIDALCIVQDSKQDWAAEAAKMGQYYEGAYVNISVVSSRDGRGGCLTERQSRSEVRLQAAQELDGGVFVRLPHQHVYENYLQTGSIIDASKQAEVLPIIKGVASRFPLIWRKWCFQERMLSNRVVHYTRDELVWECKEGVVCECESKTREISAYGTKWQTSYVLENPDDTVGAFSAYLNLVEEYSMRALTFPTDVLPAFSAMARKFENHLGEYHAGLWTRGLAEMLCWNVSKLSKVPFVQQAQRPSQYCAPTWSWASIQGPVEFEYNKLQTEHSNNAQVISVSSEKIDEDKFGRIEMAKLTLEAFSIRCKISSVDIDKSLIYFEGWQRGYECKIDIEEDWKYLAKRQPEMWIVCLFQNTQEEEGGVFLLLLPNSDETFKRIGIYKHGRMSVGLTHAPDRASVELNGKFAKLAKKHTFEIV